MLRRLWARIKAWFSSIRFRSSLLLEGINDAECHVANLPKQEVATGKRKCPVCDGNGYTEEAGGAIMRECRNCKGTGRV